MGDGDDFAIRMPLFERAVFPALLSGYHDGLLRAAVRQNPNDHASRRRLVVCLAGHLRHSLHELPAGVLYGMDGATPDQCLELEGELEELCEMVAGRPDYRELVEQCRFHFPAYRDFTQGGEVGMSYENYLKRRGAGGCPPG